MGNPETPRLSLCMIVRNEEKNLPSCLDSVRGLADEVIIVDTGSTDATRDIARDRGARVIEIVWENHFSRARNTGLEAARGKWILVLDADETLPETSRQQIRQLIAQPANRAFNLVQKNLLDGGKNHVSVQAVRLFPNHPRVRYEREIHEQVNTSLERQRIPIVDTAIDFIHTGYVEGAVLRGKTERNRAIIHAALEREPDGDPNLRYFYASSFFDAQEFERAAEEYEECARRSAANYKKLEAAAKIKAAQAWFLAGKLERAAALLQRLDPGGMHPLAVELLGEIAAKRGNIEEAVRWQEHLLSVKDDVYLPPVALGPMQVQALMQLANYWAGKGRKDTGVKLLRLAQEVAVGGRPVGPQVGEAYRHAIR